MPKDRLVVSGGPFLVGRKAGDSWEVYDEGFPTRVAAEKFIATQTGELAVIDMRDCWRKVMSGAGNA